ncbi:C40 family peptidase [Sulfobacillus harzensis]|uniref:C40 family peptidase n=1 Tax=Sulfobacillus harzensis TaxID=2729629 RepID=UPI001FACCCF5|nr:C40 family peptidase [Sulfobacillus harzensis]
MHIRWTGAVAGIAVASALSLTGLAQAASPTGVHGAAVHDSQTPSASGVSSSTASPTFEAAPATTYRVQPGNTLGGIAARFHTTWEHLAAINHLANPNLLLVGQVLRLTGTVTKPAAPTVVQSAVHTYRVQPGNTLSGIASRFHTTWPVLARLNHLSNPNILRVGQVLTLPGGSVSASANKPVSGSTGSGNGSASVSLPAASAPQSLDQAIVSTAFKYLGVPYVWGGESPRGFDCSGLVQYVLAQNGISIGRTSWQQWNDVNHIAKSQLVPGDLVFFDTYSTGASHVGIYIGSYPKLGYSRAFIDAPAPGQSVMVQNFNNEYWVSHYYGAGAVRR